MSTGEDPVRDDDAARPPVGGATVPDDAPRVPAGPAPIIDLDGDAVPVQPVKPLGPRRLARLQRELAERSRELAGTGSDPADPGLLEKQRRFAELAAGAAAGNVPATDEARSGADGAGGVQAAAPATTPAVAEPEPPGEAEQITVVFPDGPGGAADHDLHDPVHVDPALFGHRLAPEELAALTHIEVLPPDEPGRSGSHSAPPPGTAEAAEAVEPVGAEPAPPGPAGVDEEEPVPPAAPVPAASAEGLELLDPREYRRRPVNRWLVLLLLAVVAALVVVVVLFVL